jgi:hypothetical protein
MTLSEYFSYMKPPMHLHSYQSHRLSHKKSSYSMSSVCSPAFLYAGKRPLQNCVRNQGLMFLPLSHVKLEFSLRFSVLVCMMTRDRPRFRVL